MTWESAKASEASGHITTWAPFWITAMQVKQRREHTHYLWEHYIMRKEEIKRHDPRKAAELI